MEFNFIRASQLKNHFREHIFSKLDEVVVISISHIKFTACIFGVVGLIDRLVSKVLTDFEYSI